MGTKANPSPYDCYAKAEPDEPMFILLARDRAAPHLIRKWARWSKNAGTDPAKIAEARKCADDMIAWRRERR